MKICVWSVQQWNCNKLSAIMPAVSFLVTMLTCLFKNSELWLGVLQWRIPIPDRTTSFKKCKQDFGRRTIWTHLQWKILYKLRRPWEYDIKTDLKQTDLGGGGGVDWLHLAPSRSNGRILWIRKAIFGIQ